MPKSATAKNVVAPTAIKGSRPPKNTSAAKRLPQKRGKEEGVSPADHLKKPTNDQIPLGAAHEDIEKGQNGKMTLLQACESGDIDAVSDLIDDGKADFTALDKDGRNCLLVAIDNRQEDIIWELLDDPDWREMFKCEVIRNHVRCTPMRELIKTILDVDVAKEILDRSISVEEDAYAKAGFATYDYELLEDSYSQWKPKVDITSNPVQVLSKKSNWHGATDLIRNHPLTLMVEYRRDELLDHALVRRLVDHKWASNGSFTFYITSLINLLSLIFFNVYLVLSVPPYATTTIPGNYTDDMYLCPQAIQDFDMYNGTVSKPKLQYTQTMSMTALAVILIFFSALCLAKEMTQLYFRRLKYFLSMINLMELFAYCTAIVFGIFYNPCSSERYRMGLLWQTAACGVFCAWINMIWLLSKTPSFGIYVIMFAEVGRTFLQVFVLFILFILAFAVPFYALVQNQKGFKTLFASITKTMIMMVGEFDSANILRPSADSYETKVFFEDLTESLFLLFVVVASILLMNLLVGLAVGDIQTIRQKAKVMRLALQIQLVLEAEHLLPKICTRQTFVSKEEVVEANQRGKSLLDRFFGLCDKVPVINLFRYVFNVERDAYELPKMDEDSEDEAFDDLGELVSTEADETRKTIEDKMAALTTELQKIREAHESLTELMVALGKQYHKGQHRERGNSM